MKLLAIIFILELGYVPEAQLWNYTNELIVEKHQLYSEFIVEAVFLDTFFITGGIETRTHKSTDFWGFVPIRDLYRFGAGVKLDHFELGWRHMCTHPVAANWHFVTSQVSEAAQDEFYLRISGEL
jgi:hypothetical protein